jgi:hypothetical protein
MDIERLTERLGAAGITVILKVDHERMVPDAKPWTWVLSGPGTGERGLIRTDAISLQQAMEYCLRELAACPGEWSWLAEYL